MCVEEEEVPALSTSYFWNCITFSEDCPFFTTVDPKLRYFGFGIAILYGAFLLMILADMGFFWSLDNLQHQVDYYINLVTTKVKRVQMDQRRLMSVQERATKQKKRSEDCTRLVSSLRGALHSENPKDIALLTNFDDTTSADATDWNSFLNIVDY
ncbi:uncharacterized protein LOC126369780 [Pectinophora gossypiella]|uniref:uncharacterized protein LOC126369780 n=1 Tax=Pectinophora gossypiella TaxID=13191 RepID=UPI00214E0AE4|nr:uncharacterized protein LOC126369780 [Pectinophora gossypiella]